MRQLKKSPPDGELFRSDDPEGSSVEPDQSVEQTMQGLTTSQGRVRIDGLVDLRERVEEAPRVPRLEVRMAGFSPFTQYIRNLCRGDGGTIDSADREIMPQPISHRFGPVGVHPLIQFVETISQLSHGTSREVSEIPVGELGVFPTDPDLAREGEIVTDEYTGTGNETGRVGLIVTVPQSDDPAVIGLGLIPG